MKRLITPVILATMLLSCLKIVYAQEDKEQLTRVRAVEEIVKTLFLSGGDTSFTFEDYYCLHPGEGGYAHFVLDEDLLENGYPVLCAIYTSVDGCGFSDISEENENLSVFITIAKAMGIVNGYEDNTFRPDKPVTYNEAVKMLVCAFGFDGLAEADGGYPDGYIKNAEEAGITPGISFNGNDVVNYQDFSAMLAASFDVSNAGIKNLTGMFIPPVTPDECAQAYAKAVMDRNGAAQFALYSDELKDATRDDFMGFHWVSGVSSPWVSGFDIMRTDDLEFEVIFHYATSTGPSDNDVTIKLLLHQINGVYSIVNLERIFA